MSLNDHAPRPDTSSSTGHPPTARLKAAVDRDTPPKDEHGLEMYNDSADESTEDNADGTHGASPVGPQGKKRKRCRSGLEKKFGCPEEGCNKSYSRSEHLYRHQLNHTPKQIFHCGFADCQRSFVRRDLCIRHRERHGGNGHWKRFPAKQQVEMGKYNVSIAPKSLTLSSESNNFTLGKRSTSPETVQHESVLAQHGQSTAMAGSATIELDCHTSTDRAVDPSGMQSPYHPRSPQLQLESSSIGTDVQNGVVGSYNHNRSPSSHFDQYGTISREAYKPAMFKQSKPRSTPASPPFEHRRTYLEKQPKYATHSPLLPSSHSATVSNTEFHPSGRQSDTSRGVLIDSPLTEDSFPTHDGEGYNRFPTAMRDNFTAWLFNSSPNREAGDHQTAPTIPIDGKMSKSRVNSLSVPLHTQHIMSLKTVLTTSDQRPLIISEEKRREVLELIHRRFDDSASPVGQLRDILLSGDLDHDAHVLSLQSIRTYIGSYWFHFSDQMPILHQPTFSADNTPLLLLMVIIAIGASNLDKIHGYEVTEAGAQLAKFLAWHLRVEIFRDMDSHPPAKLWVLQALLLLEVYEKMYSSIASHERAQMHHATTINLLQRGSVLLGWFREDQERDLEEANIAVPNNTLDPAWYRWIVRESIRRIAFAIFIIDSVHAAMFSHTAGMGAHQMRIPLPCDEALWSASSDTELAALAHIKSMNFLDALRLTLSGKSVRTNVFGRTALMAGLLNVTFQQEQRDKTIESIGPIGALDDWKTSMTKAFDFWEFDWDEEAPTEVKRALIPQSRFFKSEAENIFESRVVLRHLAHMVVNADIVQCQIFAGASRLLGRKVSEKEAEMTAIKMRDKWAPSAEARSAVFYALRFLRQVLAPDIVPGASVPAPTWRGDKEYNARDDYLLNRPWVLVFATLIVWSWAYALDGPLKPHRVPANLQLADCARDDMRVYMETVGSVHTPEDLKRVKDCNACAGLLVVMIHLTKQCRWEVMNEASVLLENCVVKLVQGKGEEEIRQYIE